MYTKFKFIYMMAFTVIENNQKKKVNIKETIPKIHPVEERGCLNFHFY